MSKFFSLISFVLSHLKITLSKILYFNPLFGHIFPQKHHRFIGRSVRISILVTVITTCSKLIEDLSKKNCTCEDISQLLKSNNKTKNDINKIYEF